MKTESFPEKSHSHPPYAWRRATRKIIGWLALLTLAGSMTVQAGPPAPNLLNYQGRVTVNGVNFDSPPNGQFKFAIVSNTGATTFWRNDGSTANGEPGSSVSLTVTKAHTLGHYAMRIHLTATAGVH